MTNNKETGHYIRKNRNIGAIIYIDGERKIEQKLFCQMYALENHYHVLDITENIKDIDNCDVMIVANASRVSRIEKEYCEVVNKLKENGIKIEVAINEENAERYLDLITKGFKNIKSNK